MNHKIYYGSSVKDETCLIRQSVFENDKDYPYGKCPVFKHLSNRIFVGVSPIDFYLNFDRTNENLKLTCDNMDLINPECLVDHHLWSPDPLIQLLFPTFLFWTKSKNIWFEYYDHPMTSLNNNVIAISGWYNLTNWPRRTSAAFKIVDETKPVVFKRGDPLFRVKFIPPNLNDGIVLSYEKNQDKIDEIIAIEEKNRNEKDYKKLFFKTEPKKCPFRFLFRK